MNYFSLSKSTLLFFCFWPMQLAFATVIYSVDWESKPGTPWSYTGGAPFVDCSVPPSPSGGCALEFVYPAGSYSSSFSGGRAEINFPTTYSELWIGHWNRYSSGFIWNGNGTKMDFLVLADRGQFNSAGNMAVGWKGNPNAPTQVSSNQIVWGPTTQDFSCNYTATTNEWVWVEEHFRINTPGLSDGLFELYINGVKKCSHSNVPYRDSSVTTGWGTFFHTAEWGGGGGTVPANQYWWVDHTVISTTPIGVPGGAPPSSAPVPPPSTGNAASVKSFVLDASGASINFNGLAYKIRYWNDSIAQASALEITGLNGVSTYRHNINLSGKTYQCYQAQGSDGIWEISQMCAVPAAIIKPKAPLGLRLIN